jgi:hypothetical protein
MYTAFFRGDLVNILPRSPPKSTKKIIKLMLFSLQFYTDS